MNPTLWDSDLLEVLPCRKDQIQIGDVIAFRTYYCEDYTVHRVIEIEDRGFKTRGDSNDSVDPFWVQPHHVVGKILSLWRGHRTMKVLSGMAGLIWSYFIRAITELDRAISPKLHPLYRSLSTNNRRLTNLLNQYQPQIQRFRGDGQTYYKVVIGSRVVGLYDHNVGEWRIRRPFRLVVDGERLAEIGERERVKRETECVMSKE